MDPTALAAYVVAAVALIVLPGPDWAFMLSVGAHERPTVPAALGLALGYVVMALVVAAGVAPLVAAAPLALVVVAVAGATYLVYVGVGIVRTSIHARPSAELPAPAPSDLAAAVVRGSSTTRRLMWRGVGVSALNPKSLVLFVAFLPQFVRQSAPWPVGAQLAVLGLLWAAIGGVFYTALGLTAHRTVGARPTLAKAVGRFIGVAMIVGGIALAGEQLLHALG